MRSIEWLIDNLEEHTLTGRQVTQISGGVPVVAYHELPSYGTIDDLLGNEHEAVILLFETHYNVGHYVALYRLSDGLHYFDPYGMKPDQELKFATYNHIPHLTHMLGSTPVKVSTHRYQQWSDQINTCGRHVGVRLRTRHIWNDERYKALLGSGGMTHKADWYVSCMTVLFTLQPGD